MRSVSLPHKLELLWEATRHPNKKHKQQTHRKRTGQRMGGKGEDVCSAGRIIKPETIVAELWGSCG